MPPSYVKPYVKRQKNDAADAEAICEAVTRPTMRFVEVKRAQSTAHFGAGCTVKQLDRLITKRLALRATALQAQKNCFDSFKPWPW